jgi:hypothetical protein
MNPRASRRRVSGFHSSRSAFGFEIRARSVGGECPLRRLTRLHASSLRQPTRGLRPLTGIQPESLATRVRRLRRPSVAVMSFGESEGVLRRRLKRATKETSDLPAEPAVALWAPPELALPPKEDPLRRTGATILKPSGRHDGPAGCYPALSAASASALNFPSL